MHLQRIRVPDFRVLKDVDITFENNFVPRIFPLGSLNGGGKSTLLQLIFTLLHCSNAPEKKPFLQNFLYGFKLRDDSTKRTLAIIDIWENSKVFSLDFFCCKASYITRQWQVNDDLILPKHFPLFLTVKILSETSIEFDNIDHTKLANKIENRIINYYKENKIAIKDTKNMVKGYLNLLINIKPSLSKIRKYIESNCLIFISDYRVENKEKNIFLCRIDGLNIPKISDSKSFVNNLQKKIFIAVPSTQVFLFMAQNDRELLLKSDSNQKNRYYSQLQSTKAQLRNLFTYDFFAVDILIQAFKDARDRDFREAIETGEYGNHYQRLKNELNQMLFNKKINIDKDLNGVNFTLDRNGETIELSPEDLSHGELKRLSIYMWLKHYNIEDAIVLMDEIEIAFHPDWQYQIIRDLQEWAPNNQYILATHSYELCQALTPAHVKELEPKLIKQDPEN
ncbi:MAG: AAA family ATPase [Coleofasciculus sp. C1-SOL-03]|uniref:AAA family ATPase n=1 Tax=Coleofasciculus sp. C1-SOL-03 TaxID=3069522 RepID=UPI0033011601